MQDLEALGWDRAWQDAFDALTEPALAPARVSEQHKETYRVRTADGEVWAKTTGRLHWDAHHSTELPAVGDWVAVSLHDAGTFARIHACLPRRSALTRKVSAENVVAAQVVAANVDVVFVVTSLNRDFNPRRIERALALVWESGASPVLVLSKADLVPDPDERAAAVAAAEAVALGVPVHVVSAQAREGLDALAPHLAGTRTAVLMGTSGVGKSTLTNCLVGAPLQIVQSIRSDDDRGRHTTTTRHLLPLPGGGCLIDTPGLRAVSLWQSEEGVREAFADIEELAASCRFRDCTHEDEPGCRVRAGIAPDRLAAYRKLERELAFQRRKESRTGAANTKRRWKQIHEDMRRRRREEGG